MKILAFGDTHGSMKALDSIVSTAKKEKADIVLCTGDVSVFEQDLSKIMKKLDTIGKPVMIVPGNHESERSLKEISRKSKNIVYLNKGMLKFRNYAFMGFSGDGFSMNDPEFARWGKMVKNDLKKNDIVILITHAPPYKTKLDNIMGSHCGNKDIRKFIESGKIAYAISGHIHETAGREDSIKGTKVLNPGPKGKIIEI